MAGPQWTPAEDETLRTLAAAGKNAVEIARNVDRPATSVRHRASLLRILIPKIHKSSTNPAWSPEQDRRLRKLAAEGLSVIEMASQLQRGQSAVRARTYALQIPVAKSGYQGLGLKAKK